jgi:hypothetical protein
MLWAQVKSKNGLNNVHTSSKRPSQHVDVSYHICADGSDPARALSNPRICVVPGKYYSRITERFKQLKQQLKHAETKGKVVHKMLCLTQKRNDELKSQLTLEKESHANAEQLVLSLRSQLEDVQSRKDEINLQSSAFGHELRSKEVQIQVQSTEIQQGSPLFQRTEQLCPPQVAEAHLQEVQQPNPAHIPNTANYGPDQLRSLVRIPLFGATVRCLYLVICPLFIMLFVAAQTASIRYLVGYCRLSLSDKHAEHRLVAGKISKFMAARGKSSVYSHLSLHMAKYLCYVLAMEINRVFNSIGITLVLASDMAVSVLSDGIRSNGGVSNCCIESWSANN